MLNSPAMSIQNPLSGYADSFGADYNLATDTELPEARELQTTGSINELYRDAWSRFATGVTVITTVEPGGTVHGMTASSVASVSLDPPLVLVVIGEERQSHGLISSTGRFGLSILDSSQTEIAKHFATPPETRGETDPEHIAALSDEMPDTPVIANAIAAMGCRVTAAHQAGDHTVFIGEVELIRVGEGDPLVWFQRQFGGFADQNSD